MQGRRVGPLSDCRFALMLAEQAVRGRIDSLAVARVSDDEHALVLLASDADGRVELGLACEWEVGSERREPEW